MSKNINIKYAVFYWIWFQLNSTQLNSIHILFDTSAVQCILTLLTVINDMSLIECHSFNTENYFDTVFIFPFFFSFSFSSHQNFSDLTIYTVCVCVTHFVYYGSFLFLSPHTLSSEQVVFLYPNGNRQFGFHSGPELHWFSLCDRAHSDVRINFPHHLVDLILNQIQWEKFHSMLPWWVSTRRTISPVIIVWTYFLYKLLVFSISISLKVIFVQCLSNFISFCAYSYIFLAN